MRKMLLFGIIFLFVSFVSAEAPPPGFDGLIGGKLDPNIGLLKDATIITTLNQVNSVIIQSDSVATEKVLVEYLWDTPLDVYIPLEWEQYHTKLREEEIDINKLQKLADSNQVFSVWAVTATTTIDSLDCNWGYNSFTSKQLWEQIKVADMWTGGYTGQGVTVMVVDTGIHPTPYINIQSVLTKGKDYDANYHGTSSASIIGSNDPNYPGAAPETKIIDCPAIGPNMPYDPYNCFAYAISQYIKDGTPQIISNSWSFLTPVSQNDATVRLIKMASDKGIIIVMAAGNCGSGCGSYTACCDGSGKTVSQGCIDKDKYRGTGKSINGPNQLTDVITVAAVDPTSNKREGYSSQGPSYSPGGIYTYNKPNIAGYADFQIKPTSTLVHTFAGTSAATPTISGIIALMLSANPKLNAGQVRANLYKTAITPSIYNTLTSYNDIGNGIVSIKAVTASTPICGNNYCETGEDNTLCPQDCKNACDGYDCNDADTCTLDACSIQNNNPSCSHQAISPCCGNGVCEYGENVWSCSTDCDKWQCENNCQYLVTTNNVVAKTNDFCAPECEEFCGDKTCQSTENSDECPQDCGPTTNTGGITTNPIIIGTIIGIIGILIGIYLWRRR